MKPSSAEATWKDILVNGSDLPPTQAVLLQLSEYSGKPVGEVKEIATNSNSISKQKWDEADRSTPEGLRSFYLRNHNWVFGTLSYHARQAEGLIGPTPPLPVQVAEALKDLPPGRHLDFGCGVGTASLLFGRYGWLLTLADVSTPLLDFAKWRTQQAKARAEFVDLNTEDLPANHFDLITAFNTMAHVPNAVSSISQLRKALKPDGLLIFDIDARRPAPGDEWFLYQYHYQVIQQIRSKGFERLSRIGPMYVYKRKERTKIDSWTIGVLDLLRYNAITTKLSSLRWWMRGWSKKILAAGVFGVAFKAPS
ncbi:class I SAM-dependent methyltransferase [Methylobacterium sp. NMS14P]|uniref:class I SAM-dependent methyltransferase n=1 Tax=Methylobacterium sp. NMS14P TaxID=2894310 RepID=UPI0023592BFF|nr:methyltransferase domain-containing protein [Methylobacterium sp. NMS14P]WCS22786.1 class I SAM-dependent methyltransferase [Methylobacterium sp. NMS14P]